MTGRTSPCCPGNANPARGSTGRKARYWSVHAVIIGRLSAWNSPEGDAHFLQAARGLCGSPRRVSVSRRAAVVQG